MSGNAWAALGLLLLALVLPLAALRHERIATGKALRMVAIWIAIFVVATLAFATLRG